MRGEWTTCTVADVAAEKRNAIVGGPFGSNLVSRDYVAVGVPVIRGANMANRWVGGEFAFVSVEKSESLAANHAEPGDIVFTQRGTLGQVALVPEKPYARYLVSQSQMKLTVDRQKASPLFLYYVFCSEEQLEYIRKNAIQTGVPHTNLGLLRTTPLVLPPLPTQRAIAHILGTLDDKIELNRKMNATLEAMARALFKSWFVDFDPVHAKSEGRAPSGMDAETAKLFPSEFVESELGRIPRGWRVGNIGDVAVNRRDTIHPKDVKSGSVYVGLEHLARGRIFLEEMGVPDGLESLKATFSKGEVLFGKLRPYFKKVAVAPCDGICSTEVLVFSPNTKSTAFVTLLAASDPFIEHAVALSSGTRMPRTSWEQLKRFEVVVPSNDVLYAFEDRCVSLFRRVESARSDSTTLAQLRDTLLPRLLSGELSVAEAEDVVSEVA